MNFRNFRKNFTQSSNYFFVLIIIFFFIINQNYILLGGIFYDDWSLATQYSELSFFERLKIHALLFFNTRPVGAFYAALITGLGKNDFLYILINSSVWLCSGLILFKIFKKFLSEVSAEIFLLLFLFPSFASTPFFSPVTQSLTGLSILFWSISIYFSYEKKFKFVTIFYILSVLTYEVSVVLFLFNILILIDPSSFKVDRLLYIKKVLNFLIKFILIILSIIIFQFIISKLTNNTAPLKYAFQIVDNYLVIEEDFYFNLKKYFFKPLSLILIDIPELFLRSILFIKFNIINLLNYIFLFYFIYVLAKSNYGVQSKSNNFNYLFLIFILFSTLFVFFMYLIVTSVPQVNGYYNRGLTGLFIIFSIFFAYLGQLKFNNFLINLFMRIFILLIIILNFNSFLIQKNNHVKAGLEREKILNEVNLYFKNKGPSNLFLKVNTFLEENYNDEVIFSEEVDDLVFSIRYYTNGKVLGRRIFPSENCIDVIEIVDNKAYGNVPSRNRKLEERINIEMINDLKNRDIYLYNEGKFFKIFKNNKIDYNVLSDEIKCKIL